MAFRLRKDTREWFKPIEPNLDLDFDMFYFCLMAGLAAGRKAFSSAAETTELVDHFPGEYRSRGRLIVSLFLARELKALGIRFEERAVLHQEISRLIDPLSASHLSSEGMEEFNRYSYGGFDVLSECFEDKPRHLETFLPKFTQLLANFLGAQPDKAQ